MSASDQPPALEVFWRPGCPFCTRMRAGLKRRGVPAQWRNIHVDAEAREIVRGANGGDETVPTVRLGDVTLTNPRPKEVAALLQEQTGWVPPAQPSLLERVLRR